MSEEPSRENNMTSIFLIIGIILVLCFLSLAFILNRSSRRLRGTHVEASREGEETPAIEVKAPPAVEVKASPARRTGATVGMKITNSASTGSFHESLLRSRLPERQDSGQEPVAQVEKRPDEWLIRERLAQQYRDAPCSVCGKTIGAIHFVRKPGLVNDPDAKTIDWSGITPEDLPALLKTHEPVCWNCHLAESFRRHFPGRLEKDPPSPAPPESEPDTKLVS